MIEGEGTPASGNTGRLEKGTSGGEKPGLLLQLCGVTRALACRDCELIQLRKAEMIDNIPSVQIVTDWATSST
jgi:hypothetical protein